LSFLHEVNKTPIAKTTVKTKVNFFMFFDFGD